MGPYVMQISFKTANKFIFDMKLKRVTIRMAQGDSTNREQNISNLEMAANMVNSCDSN